MSAWIFGLVTIELLVVSWFDIKTRKISNLWFPVNLLASVLLYVLLPEPYDWSWQILIFPASWVVVGFVLFALDVMGAGDSKYLASLFLLIPLSLHFPMLEKIVGVTIVVGGIFLTIKVVRDFAKIKSYALSAYWVGLRESIRSKFSFAPVILLAWLMLGVELWK